MKPIYKMNAEDKRLARAEKESRGECKCLKCSLPAEYEGYCGHCFAGDGVCE